MCRSLSSRTMDVWVCDIHLFFHAFITRSHVDHLYYSNFKLLNSMHVNQQHIHMEMNMKR